MTFEPVGLSARIGFLVRHWLPLLIAVIAVTVGAWWMERSATTRRFLVAGATATAAAVALWFVSPDAVINCGWTCDLFWWLV